MGDILTLVEKAQETVDQKKAEEFAKRPLAVKASRWKIFATSFGRLRSWGLLQACRSRCYPALAPSANMQKAADSVDGRMSEMKLIATTTRSSTEAEHKRISPRLRHQRAGSERLCCREHAHAQNIQAWASRLQPQARGDDCRG